MTLTEAAGTIIAEDDRASLWKRIAELEKDKSTLQRVVDLGTEDYNLVVTGNRKLSSQRNELKLRCESLEADLARVCSNAEK
jgi:molybdopterin converting factor small subunit